MKFCKYCGRELSDTSRFCPTCGKEIIIEEKHNEKIVKAKPSKSKPSKSKLIIIILCICVAIAIIASIVIRFLNNTDAEEIIEDTEVVEDIENEEIISQDVEVVTWQDQYDLGITYFAQENYDDAITAFETAIDIDPENIEAYIALAACILR